MIPEKQGTTPDKAIDSLDKLLTFNGLGRIQCGYKIRSPWFTTKKSTPTTHSTTVGGYHLKRR